MCGANCGPGSRISNILANIITPFNKAIAGECQVQSTEDLQAKIEEFNMDEISKRMECEVFSMDVKTLYPSLDIDRTAHAVEEVILESEVRFHEIDEVELARYIAVTVNETEIQRRQMSDVVMTRKKTGGRKPCVTGTEMTKGWKDETSLWNAPVRAPSEEEVKGMLASAVSSDVKCVMESHVYRFREGLYKQKDGGATGNELTCVIAKTRMILYIRKLKRRSELLGLSIRLVWVHVDDTLVASKRVAKGTRLSDDKHQLIWSEEWEQEDQEISDDVVTARLMCDVANTIEEDIVMISTGGCTKYILD